MKIAIVGSGISGLICAHVLSKKYQVTIFESEQWVGGHTHTVPVEKGGVIDWVDTGFIVCNPVNYKYFFPFLKKIGAPLQKTEMTFSVKSIQNDLEYAGSNLNTIFTQRNNIFNFRFLRMLNGILKFNREARKLVLSPATKMTLKSYIDSICLDQYTYDYYLIPMISAIWSCDSSNIGEIPAWFVCKFLDNHGLLSINDRPQWYTIKGGSHEYIKLILSELKAKILTNCPVKSIDRVSNGITLLTEDEQYHFDKVIIACHSDQALGIINNPTRDEIDILGAIKYKPNEVVLHTDTSLLPSHKRAWSSWNYYIPKNNKESLSVTYYMNKLQNLNSKNNYCVSLNSSAYIDSNKIIDAYVYSHPVFNMQAVKAQDRYDEISGIGNTYYSGAYWKYGFHEDGFQSGLRAISKIDKELLCKVLSIQDM